MTSNKSILSSPEFRLSLEIVGIVLMVCVLVYVSCVCVLLMEPQKDERPRFEDDAERRHLQPWLDTLEADSSDYEADSEDCSCQETAASNHEDV